MQRTLIVMVKTPRAGRVKTRLGRDIGMTSAAWWFRHQCLRLMRRIQDPRWQVVLAVSPDVDGMTSRIWPTHLPRIPQGHGDLGQRMGRLLRTAPKGPVCVIGADIPGIDRPHIARAFAALGSHDAVFGPAMDGGYWLVGLKNLRPAPQSMFAGVRWSTRHALDDTRATLSDMRIAQVDKLQDIDTLDDLRGFYAN